MDIKAGLCRQYDASIRMLRDCVQKCPKNIWNRPGERPAWKIAYHCLFYTHLYLMADMTKFKPWEMHREGAEDIHSETSTEPYSQAEILTYLEFLREMIPAQVESLDLDSQVSGFPWYNMPKFDHQLVNLRHIMAHVGQLSELLMIEGIDSDWFGGSLPSE